METSSADWSRRPRTISKVNDHFKDYKSTRYTFHTDHVVDTAYCYRSRTQQRGGLCVSGTRLCCSKHGKPIVSQFGTYSCGPKEPCIGWGLDSPPPQKKQRATGTFEQTCDGPL